MITVPRSGTPFTIRAEGYTAEIASIGASLRTLRHDGRDLVLPFGVDELRPHSRGALLAPWPNRVIDGRYTFAGTAYVLALTEPARGHAIHGFTRWLDFTASVHAADELTLAASVVPQSGYPWRVRIETTFRVDAGGLTQTVRAVNEGEDAAPFGAAAHPYLVAGPNPLDTWTLELPASAVLETTPDRLVPVALHPVAEYDPERFDRRAPRPLGAVTLDHAFTDLARDGLGRARVRVTDPSGTGVELAFGSACPWVQVYTGDLPGGPAQPGHRGGLAVEPMTCAPDAFNAADHPYDSDLIVLAPGEATEASWRISAI